MTAILVIVGVIAIVVFLAVAVLAYPRDGSF